MRAFVALGDAATEKWLKAALGVQYTEDFEHATHALVSRLSDAKRALAAGHEVRFVTAAGAEGARLAKAAALLGVSCIEEAPARASDLIPYLMGQAAPEVRVSSRPFTLLVTSSKGGGGTFFCWNLQAALTEQSIPALVLSLSRRSPLEKWVSQDADWLRHGLDDAPTDKSVWIVDASGAENTSVEADAHLHVIDGDPAKWDIPEGAKVVCNRWPEDEQPLKDACLVIPDFGYEQFAAMRSGEAVSHQEPSFAQALCGLYETLSPGAEILGEKSAAPATVHAAPPSETDGFDLEG